MFASVFHRSLRMRLLVGALAIDILLGALFTFSAYRVIRDWIATDVVVDARALNQSARRLGGPLLVELNLGALQELLDEAQAVAPTWPTSRILESTSGRVLGQHRHSADRPGGSGRDDRRLGSTRAGVAGFRSVRTILAARSRSPAVSYGQLEFGISSIGRRARL